MSELHLKKSKPLPPNGTIGVIALGSPVSRERFELGVRELKDRGFQIVSPFDPAEYYGSTELGFASQSAICRAQAFHELLENPAVSHILAVRGAYGTLDTLSLIDFQKVATARKLLIGCSDITALLTQFVFRSGIPAIHGATLASSFADAGTDRAALESVNLLIRMLQQTDFRFTEKADVLRSGKAAGHLIVGNLTMLNCLLGTPWDFDYSGSILVLEDVGEAPYRIHRAMRQLQMAGKLRGLAALVFGRFAKCTAPHGPTIDEVFALVKDEMLRDTDYPVLKNLEVGHYGKNIPLPLGCRAEITEDCFRLVESPIQA